MNTLTPVVFTDWCSTDPNNLAGENCIRYVHECDFAWQDHSCNNEHTRFICEDKPEIFQLLQYKE